MARLELMDSGEDRAVALSPQAPLSQGDGKEGWNGRCGNDAPATVVPLVAFVPVVPWNAFHGTAMPVATTRCPRPETSQNTNEIIQIHSLLNIKETVK